MRESCIFYKSFYDSIKKLDPIDQVQIYNAIFEYQFNGKEIELDGICESIFTLIIPQLRANNKRYENGKKGGAPKGNQNAKKINQKTTKKQPNENVNVNDNVNVNVNDNNIYEFIEQNFGRTLSPVEYELISTWEDNELTRYAIKQTVLNRATSIKYTQAILNSYKAKGIKTVMEAENLNKKETPSCFVEVPKQEIKYTKEEQEIYDRIR